MNHVSAIVNMIMEARVMLCEVCMYIILTCHFLTLLEFIPYQFTVHKPSTHFYLKTGAKTKGSKQFLPCLWPVGVAPYTFDFCYRFISERSKILPFQLGCYLLMVLMMFI